MLMAPVLFRLVRTLGAARKIFFLRVWLGISSFRKFVKQEPLLLQLAHLKHLFAHKSIFRLSQKHLLALLEQVGTAFEFHLIWFVSCRRFGPEFWSKSGSKLHPPFLLLFFKLCFFKNLFTNQHLFRSHTNANVALGVVSASPMETCRRTKYMYVCRRGETPTKHINSLLSFRR